MTGWEMGSTGVQEIRIVLGTFEKDCEFLEKDPRNWKWEEDPIPYRPQTF